LSPKEKEYQDNALYTMYFWPYRFMLLSL